MKTRLILAAAIAAIWPCLVASGPARADGGGGGAGGGSTTTRSDCPQGEVYDPRTGKCTKFQAHAIPDAIVAEYAYAVIKAGRYREAIGWLDRLDDPNSAVALNYRGYATRKLGRVDEGIGYYLKSVALDPGYAQVREYLGEAYLVKGDVASANTQLQAIKQICGTVCDEYQHLAVAIADPSSL